MCGLCEVFEFCYFFNFFLISEYIFTVCMVCHIFCLPLVCLGQLSDFLSSDCLSVGLFPFVLLFRWIEQHRQQTFKFARFPPSVLTPLEMSASLRTFSVTAVNNLGESGSSCLTPLFIGNSSDTNLSTWILAEVGCRCLVKCLRILRLCYFSLCASKMAKSSTVSKAFS